MKRAKRHKIKQETPETSTSRFKEQEEHDLAYYIHDRVELMHQVFSVIKPKELKAMAPKCVYHITVDDLQELCTEELLGISSKRLCAILDGAEPPTDTESSSSEHNLETISLDSISSDDEVLSQHSSKKRHKHKKHKSKSKHKRRSSKSDRGDQETGEEQDRSKASRAGLTVLELLELQARARAIRAQLQQDNANAPQAEAQSETKPKDETSEDEVEIKEEPAEVVEISSEDEKPKIEDLPVKPPSSSKENQTQGNSKTITKRVNDLIVTVPQTKTRKIVLNRTKSVATPSTSTVVSKMNGSSNKLDTAKSKTIDVSNAIATGSKNEVSEIVTKDKNIVSEVSKSSNKSKQKKKQKKKDKRSVKEEDYDEITLQLSDTEKMDLLEDLDRKNYESFTSSSEDSESSSESDSDNDSQVSTVISNVNHKTGGNNQDDVVPVVVDELIKTANKDVLIGKEIDNVEVDLNTDQKKSSSRVLEKDLEHMKEYDENAKQTSNITDAVQIVNIEINDNGTETTNKSLNIAASENLNFEANINNSIETPSTAAEYETGTNLETVVEIREVTNVIDRNKQESQQANTSAVIQLRNDESVLNISPNFATPDTEEMSNVNKDCYKQKSNENVITVKSVNTDGINTVETNNSVESVEEGEITNTDKDLSDGEIADHEEETEANNSVNNSSDVVCLSDEDEESRKKKKKKDKKLKKKKKEKKCKKSKSDFREGADQNFFRENNVVEDGVKQLDRQEIENNTIVIDVQEENNRHDEIVLDDDIYEILDISDDSSCYEVEGITVSKEPTATEIAALSAKIDEIHTNDVIVINEDGQFDNDERLQNVNTGEQLENISWRDRYLGSTKVKRVLTTSNILNALRKKNKELKRKLEESKEKIEEVTEKDKRVLEEISDFVEGSIEHFNALQGSSKYVDPVVPELPKDKNSEVDRVEKESGAGIKEVTKEMEKDAKQLLKMYKRLLKYNDINKKKDPNKKKKKKQKKNKEKEASNEK